MNYYTLFTVVHVAFGTVALATFWITAALRKGTPLHRRIGGSYLLSMTGVLLTTPVLAFGAFAVGKTTTGVFLLYLTIITATAVWGAWRAIRDRGAPGRYFGGSYRAIAALNLASGAAALAIGVAEREAILVGMSAIGLVIGARMVNRARRPPTERNWWLKEHYSAIVGCGIATHIAFLNIGLQRIVPADLGVAASYVGWFGPVVAAIVARWWLDRKYAGGARLARA